MGLKDLFKKKTVETEAPVQKETEKPSLQELIASGKMSYDDFANFLAKDIFKAYLEFSCSRLEVESLYIKAAGDAYLLNLDAIYTKKYGGLFSGLYRIQSGLQALNIATYDSFDEKGSKEFAAQKNKAATIKNLPNIAIPLDAYKKLAEEYKGGYDVAELAERCMQMSSLATQNKNFKYSGPYTRMDLPMPTQEELVTFFHIMETTGELYASKQPYCNDNGILIDGNGSTIENNSLFGTYPEYSKELRTENENHEMNNAQIKMWYPPMPNEQNTEANEQDNTSIYTRLAIDYASEFARLTELANSSSNKLEQRTFLYQRFIVALDGNYPLAWMRKEKGNKYSKEDFIRDCRSNFDESISGYSNIEEYINIATYLWDKWNNKKEGIDENGRILINGEAI